MLNLLLNIVGIILILYALIGIIKINKNSNIVDESFENFQVYDEDFDAEDFLQQVNSFSKILDKKQGEVVKQNEKKVIGREGVYLELSTDLNKENRAVEEEVEYRSIIRDGKTNKNKLNKKNKEIIDLHTEGYNKEEIARRTGSSIREIEVIIKLYS